MEPKAQPEYSSRNRSNSKPSSSFPERATSTLSDPYDVFSARPPPRNSSLPYKPGRKPLIEYVTNEWKHNPRYNDPSPADVCNRQFIEAIEKIPDLLRSRKIRRYLLVWTILVIITSYIWNVHLGPIWHEERRLHKSLSQVNAMKAGGVFGTNVRASFPGMVHVQSLEKSLVPNSKAPKKTSQASGKRLIFIGDIHGCKDEFTRLLEKVRYDSNTDHLVLLGDMITKGPDSLGVIDLAMELGASCIRGNHEDRILLFYKDLHSNLLPLQGQTDPESLTVKPGASDNINGESTGGEQSDIWIAKKLTKKQHHYLSSCPVILKVGYIGPMGEVVAVHAGLVPGLDLKDQDPSSVMSMRSIDLDTHVPSKYPALETDAKPSSGEADQKRRKSLVPWTKLWNKYQKMIPNPKARYMRGDKTPELRSTVIYGHDSKRGLQVGKYTMGLDTGCVKGGHLTALIVGDGATRSIASVRCKNHRTMGANDAESNESNESNDHQSQADGEFADH